MTAALPRPEPLHKRVMRSVWAHLRELASLGLLMAALVFVLTVAIAWRMG